MRLLKILTVGVSLVAVSAASMQAVARVHHVTAKKTAVASSASADDTLHTPTIADAPASDYERVAWCDGILNGDMDLAVAINSLEPTDPKIQLIGQSYLRAYEAALTLSGKGQSEAGHKLAVVARQRGHDAWAPAMKAEIHKAAWAYDSWQLPADCEHAAVRLSGHPNLFAEMATDDEAKAINEALTSGGPHDVTELPKPALTAQTAPADANAPIATNTLSIRAKQAATLPAVPAAATASSSSSGSSSVASSQH